MKPDPKWPYPLRDNPDDWDIRNLQVPDSEHRIAYLFSTACIWPIGIDRYRVRDIADRVLYAECPLLDEFLSKQKA
jgi:hypothetical protein